MKKITTIICLFLFSCTLIAQANQQNIAEYPVQIVADRFEVDISGNIINAQGNIKIQQGSLCILSDKANYTDKKEKISLTNRVKLTYKELKINCAVMIYDRQYSEIKAKKNLEVFFKDLRAVSKSLIYKVKKEKIYFKGKTTIFRKKNIIRGKDIIIDLKKNKVYSNRQTKFILEDLDSN